MNALSLYVYTLLYYFEGYVLRLRISTMRGLRSERKLKLARSRPRYTKLK